MITALNIPLAQKREQDRLAALWRKIERDRLLKSHRLAQKRTLPVVRR